MGKVAALMVVIAVLMGASLSAGTEIMPSEENAHSKPERVYVLGPSIDEPLFVAIDGDVGGNAATPSNLNKNEYEKPESDPAIVEERFDFAYYYLNNRMGSIQALLARDLIEAQGHSESGTTPHARILEYYRYTAYGTATVLLAHDDGTDYGLIKTGNFDATGPEDGSGFGEPGDSVKGEAGVPGKGQQASTTTISGLATYACK